jgi:hypothetical protein
VTPPKANLFAPSELGVRSVFLTPAGWTNWRALITSSTSKPLLLVVHLQRDHALLVDLVRARHHGVAFGASFVAGSLAELGARVARNIADAYRPVR